MEIQEAKNTLEEIGIADEITPELVEASTIVLDRLEVVENQIALNASVVQSEISNEDLTPPWTTSTPNVVDGCQCESCRRARGEPPIPQPQQPAIFPATFQTAPTVWMDDEDIEDEEGVY
jgi:hypothetical protein